MEDFGKGQLVGGKAEVHLDADFAAVVHTDEFYVFLTDRGVRDRLTVTAQSATGFTVEAGRADATGGFYWRVVAKPKSENKATRLAKFTIPTINVPGAGNVPLPPAPPAPTTPETQPQAAPPARPVQPTTSTPATGAQGSLPNPVQPIPPPRP